MQVSINFTTSVPGDFIAVLDWCKQNGVNATILAGTVKNEPGTGNREPGIGGQLGPWKESPAVKAFYASGLTKLRATEGETYHETALRRLTREGISIAGIPLKWEPEIREPGTMEPEVTPPDLSNFDDDDI